jgi:hypothetical protein
MVGKGKEVRGKMPNIKFQMPKGNELVGWLN